MLKLQETKKGRKKLKNTNFTLQDLFFTDFVMFFDRSSYIERLKKFGAILPVYYLVSLKKSQLEYNSICTIFQISTHCSLEENLVLYIVLRHFKSEYHTHCHRKEGGVINEKNLNSIIKVNFLQSLICIICSNTI